MQSWEFGPANFGRKGDWICPAGVSKKAGFAVHSDRERFGRALAHHRAECSPWLPPTAPPCTSIRLLLRRSVFVRFWCGSAERIVQRLNRNYIRFFLGNRNGHDANFVVEGQGECLGVRGQIERVSK
jgi:hypothetical protein